jgi:hypothetical protein
MDLHYGVETQKSLLADAQAGLIFPCFHSLAPKIDVL